jgi:hypothetical protein
MSLALIVTVFVGFARTYYLRGYFYTTTLRPILHVHGLVFTGWMMLFFTQTVLIARHRVAVHRRLGMVGAALAVVLVLVGLITAIDSARRNFAGGDKTALSVLATPFGDMVVFAILAGAGIRYRRRSEAHKRLMLLASVSLLGAAFVRWPLAIMSAGPVAFFGATDLFIGAAVLHDLICLRRVHQANLWGGLLIIVSQPLRLAIGRTGTWVTIATMLAG